MFSINLTILKLNKLNEKNHLKSEIQKILYLKRIYKQNSKI